MSLLAISGFQISIFSVLKLIEKKTVKFLLKTNLIFYFLLNLL